ncbi:hypothetical protein Enr13x_68940 [Stieleria neptunia]|uniref:Glycosyl hydrolases family 2, sugar binding domain n=1 Tax=Stieleria neptunia TaxID=2527979 RepID=A0A518I1K7_9BACT|nr:hypothetical protein [Stieleria neptunia]QDV46985.1 hypothetical protein Enr13x_68940 [Stieleria neptunia]
MHTIRLRRPWLRSIDPQSPPDKVDVPDTAPLAATGGDRVTYRRAFNRPTGLTPTDGVWLSISHYAADAIEVRINDTLISRSTAGEPIRVNITADLQTSNQLAITLKSSESSPAALDGAVTLEIESVDS